VTHAGGMDTTQGFGVAGQQIVKSLQELGHSTPFNKADSPVAFNFTQPYYYMYHPNQYKIGYTPWESTQLPEGWVRSMNMMEEIWTTSEYCIKSFKEDGVTAPLYLFEHGIDHIWAPSRRRSIDKIRFLHVGEPAPRKCGQMVFDAFVELFGNDPKYSLTIKSNGYSSIRATLPSGEIAHPRECYNNVTIIKKTMTVEELITLHYTHHVLVYPSYGEGFGFIPFQAMATGMPVIFNTTWAPYKRFSVGLEIKDREIDTKWPHVHPGKILEPSYESLKEQMVKVVEDYEGYNQHAFDLAPRIHEEYDWKNLTENAFEHVIKKLGN